jgi:hypothetical protein
MDPTMSFSLVFLVALGVGLVVWWRPDQTKARFERVVLMSLLLTVPLGLGLWAVSGRSTGDATEPPLEAVPVGQVPARTPASAGPELFSPGECSEAWSQMSSYERAGLTADEFQQLCTSQLGHDLVVGGSGP